MLPYWMLYYLYFFVLLGAHIFGDKALQLPVNLSRLIINGLCLSSTGFESIRVDLMMYGLLFKDILSGQRP